MKKIRGYKRREVEKRMAVVNLYVLKKVAEDVFLNSVISIGSAHNFLSHALHKHEDIVF